MARIYAIAAMDDDRLIGGDGDMPWHLPEDLKHFAARTTGHTVLMGRNTYESLPEKFRPLPNRKNVVASRAGLGSLASPEVEIVADVCEYLARVSSGQIELPSDELWIIGGGKIYELTKSYWERVYLTKIDGSHVGDVFFPEFEDDFELIEQDSRDGYSFTTYQRVA